MELRPIELPRETLDAFAGADRDSSTLLETWTCGEYTVAATHWSGLRVERDTQGQPKVSGRLFPGDTRNGDLHWSYRGNTAHFAKLMDPTGKASDWTIVPDWSVSPTGKWLWCIAGAFRMQTKRHYWHSGGLYAVNMRDDTIVSVYEPNSRTDRQLLQVCALSDADVVVMGKRALRWFRHAEDGWKQVAQQRITAGWYMSLGEVGGVPVVGVRCDSQASWKTLYFQLHKGRFVKAGELLQISHDLQIHDGKVLVHLKGEGWNEVVLSSPSARETKRKKSAKLPPHPLYKATVEIIRGPEVEQDVPAEIWEAMGRERAGAMTARMCGPGLAACASRSHLIVWREGNIERYELPKDVTRFEVTADGKHAFVTIMEIGGVRAVRERRLDVEAPWSEVPLELHGRTFTDVAALDANQIVVKSDNVMELVHRTEAGWKALHRVKCPVDSNLTSWPAKNCILQASATVLRLYGRKGDKLQKLAEGRSPTRAGGVRRATVVQSGKVFVNFCLVNITPKSPT